MTTPPARGQLPAPAQAGPLVQTGPLAQSEAPARTGPTAPTEAVPGTAHTDPTGTSAAVTSRARRAAAALPVHVWVAGAGLVVFGVAAIAPGVLAPGDPGEIDLAATLRSPSLEHWFGTDELGRDLFTRVVHGTRDSLAVGLGAAAVSLVLALVLASLTLTGRAVAVVVDRIIEVLFAFPTLLLALLVVGMFGPSPTTLAVAVGIGSAPGYARMIRAQLHAAADSGYVEAATVLGHPRGRILVQHVLPNALRPLVGVFTMSIGQSIVWASSLAFLGLGVAPPSPEWGALLDAGRTYLTAAGWLVVIPGLVIVALSLATTAVGAHLRDRLVGGH